MSRSCTTLSNVAKFVLTILCYTGYAAMVRHTLNASHPRLPSHGTNLMNKARTGHHMNFRPQMFNFPTQHYLLLNPSTALTIIKKDIFVIISKGKSIYRRMLAIFRKLLIMYSWYKLLSWSLESIASGQKNLKIAREFIDDMSFVVGTIYKPVDWAASHGENIFSIFMTTLLVGLSLAGMYPLTLLMIVVMAINESKRNRIEGLIAGGMSPE